MNDTLKHLAKFQFLELIVSQIQQIFNHPVLHCQGTKKAIRRKLVGVHYSRTFLLLILAIALLL